MPTWPAATTADSSLGASQSLSLIGCGQKTAGQAPTGAQPISVNVQRVESKPLALAAETVGRTEGSREIKIHARVNGILEKQVYEEGLPVKAGAELYRISTNCLPFDSPAGTMAMKINVTSGQLIEAPEPVFRIHSHSRFGTTMRMRCLLRQGQWVLDKPSSPVRMGGLRTGDWPQE